MMSKWYGWALFLLVLVAPAYAQAANQSLGVFAQDDPIFAGARVTNVVPGFAGAQMGLQVGDLIFQVNGNPVNVATDLAPAIQNSNPHVVITFSRGGQTFNVEGDLTPGV